ncbi:metallophosphoesterase [Enterococcus sp. BWR-S5]|uniref:metallophosphoesterase n=1 Tax=Enterococcus sp. BWR-S5 TaxID=2787714 RepID=UPI001920C091|nr:metallophosphoesterase [Enterococcus sp. BWR-S5]MBL1224437.1 metallophosphoesterase [Enterococcus sp. BWR-S5]
MGKLAIISDLHVDINQFSEQELLLLIDVLKEKQVTHLHLAGDTANHVPRVLETLDFIRSHHIPVTYNFGNHEMPSLDKAEEIESYPDASFLNQRTFELNNQLVLLAFNGWYDYSFSDETDNKKILAAKNLYWYDRFIHRGESDPVINQEILDRLKLVLDNLARESKQVVIATHFVPKQSFIVYQKGKYKRWNELNAFLGAAKTGELLDQYTNIQQVVFGHTHRRFENQIINGTIYSCHPFGYYFEWQLTREFILTQRLAEQFNPMKVRGILKTHREAFQEYRLQHLKEEFSKGVTIIDY